MKYEFDENGFIDLVSDVNKDNFTKVNVFMLSHGGKLATLDCHTCLDGEVSEERIEEVEEMTSPYISTFLQNIYILGYSLDAEAISYLSHFEDIEDLKFMLECYQNALVTIKGADKEYKPFYPNFPREVVDTPIALIYLNQLIHYFTFTSSDVTEATIRLPKYEKLMNKYPNGNYNVKDVDPSKVIPLKIDMNPTAYEEKAGRLISANTSISESDKEWFKLFFYDRSAAHTIMHVGDEIPFKENLIFMVNVITDNGCKEGLTILSKYFKTATDVLRYVVAMSGGDISLSTVKSVKFAQFKSKQRKLIMTLLNNLDYRTDKYVTYMVLDMVPYKSTWLRLSERIHPGQYSKTKYARVIKAFEILHNNEEAKVGKNFRTIFEELLAEEASHKNIVEICETMRKYPTLFARNLDAIARKVVEVNDTKTDLYFKAAFHDISTEVTTPVLLGLLRHFKERADKYSKYNHIISFHKGNKNILRMIDKYEVLPANIANSIMSSCYTALMQKFAKLDYLGSCYIDPDLNNYKIPMNMRTQNNTTRPLARGSKWYIPNNNNVIRAFVWWTNLKDSNDPVDIDLSAVLLPDFTTEPVDANKKSGPVIIDYHRIIQFYDKCDNEGKVEGTYTIGAHSGDIRNGGDYDGSGVTEYIDIPIDNIKTINKDLKKRGKQEYRYAVFSIHGYSGEKFNEMDHLQAGFMPFKSTDTYYTPGVSGKEIRKSSATSTIYVPSDVDLRFNLSTDAHSILTFAYDFETREFIWVDQAVNGIETLIPNATATLNASQMALQKTLADSEYSLTLYDLFYLHATSRGYIVENPGEADTIFSETEGITPFDTDVIMSEYLK